MDNVLVTGGAGYVGSQVCKLLKLAGFNPVTFDNLTRGHRELVKWGPLEVGDLLDASRLRHVLHQYKPSAILHFAALTFVGESVDHPERYYRNNVLGSLSLIGEALRAGVSSLVFSSTCAVYGNPIELPLRESHPCNPVSPYGSSKQAIEQALLEAEAMGLRSMILRYFNAAGADPEGETGEWHEPESHLLPLALDAAMGNNPEFTIYGSDYDTRDGTCVRDFIHVVDLGDAHVRALQYLLKGGQTQVLNLGTGTGYTVLEIIESIKRVTGREVQGRVGPRRPGDAPVLVADSTLAAELLNWKPIVPIDMIVRTAWNWSQTLQIGNQSRQHPPAPGLSL